MSSRSRWTTFVTDVMGGSDLDLENGPSDERLAAAALLVHVARADGTILPAERTGLAVLLGRRFGLTASATRRLIADADDLDREAGDLSDMIDRLGHSLDLPGKRDLVDMAYRLATVDGRLAEFEDDLVWRLAHLLGLDEADIATLRAAALAAGPILAGDV